MHIKRSVYSYAAGKGEDDDGLDARLTKGLGAFVDSGSGGQDVINQQDPLILQGCCLVRGKSAFDIVGSRRAMQFGLRWCRPDSAKMM